MPPKQSKVDRDAANANAGSDIDQPLLSEVAAPPPVIALPVDVAQQIVQLQAVTLAANAAVAAAHAASTPTRKGGRRQPTPHYDAFSSGDEESDELVHDDLPFHPSQKHSPAVRRSRVQVPSRSVRKDADSPSPPPQKKLKRDSHSRSSSYSGTDRSDRLKGYARAKHASKSKSPPRDRVKKSMKEYLSGTSSGTAGAGYSVADAEAGYQRMLADNQTAGIGRMGEMRRWCAAEVCITTIYEKEREDGAPRSAAVEFALDFCKQIRTGLTQFEHNRSTDSQVKVDELVHGVVQFAGRTGNMLADVVRRIMPQPRQYSAQQHLAYGSQNHGASSYPATSPYRSADRGQSRTPAKQEPAEDYEMKKLQMTLQIEQMRAQRESGPATNQVVAQPAAASL
jgi:hypothetical protein